MESSGRMTLYCSRTSPYSRKVRVVAAEIGIDERIDEVIVDPFQPTPELLAANPLSRIPTLVTESGHSLPDSSLIIQYLATRGQGLAPLPSDDSRWEALRRAQIAEGIIDAAVATVLEKRRPESIVYTAFLDRKADIIRRSLDLLEAEVGSLSTDERPSVQEITVGVALGYLDFRMPYLEWRTGHDALAGWFRPFAQRASMVKTQPPA